MLIGASHVIAEEFQVCNRLTVGAADFRDALPAAHEAAIDCAVYYRVATGRPDGTFDPDSPLLRGQAASLMARAGLVAGLADPTATNSFDDDNGLVHESSIDDASAYGVMRGVSGRRFDPGAPVSRAQAATVMVRVLMLTAGFEPAAVPDAFADDDGSVHEANINQAAALGLITGDGNRNVHPDAVLTRGQAMSLLTRTMERILEERTR
jgi:hypothetical protein